MTERPVDPPGEGNRAAAATMPPPHPAPATPPPPATEPAWFGRLESGQLRTYWRDEARDFTPWLAKEENLTLLGDVIGMTLELVAVEQYIGPFRADIIAKGSWTPTDTIARKHGRFGGPAVRFRVLLPSVEGL